MIAAFLGDGHGVYELAVFDLPQLFADAVNQKIGSLQKNLEAAGVENGVVRLTLDARPNPIDAEGPLPFEHTPGLHNVKMTVGDYIPGGEIHLLQARTRQGESVWHLDYVNLTHSALNRSDLPTKLVAHLVPHAKAAGVRHITINAHESRIAEEPAVSRAFIALAEAGIPLAPQTKIDWNQAAKQGWVAQAVPRKQVQFPGVDTTKYAEFKGSDTEQVAIWTNEE